ncbi:MAG: type VI secretion system membrane subunit TssM, partial [Pseudomonadales bacterium]
MKALLRNRWFIGGLGILALSLFIYFIGPLIGIGDAIPLASRTARWVTIVVLVLLWVIYELVRHIRAKRAAEQISSGIVEVESTEPDDSARSSEEVAALKARFEEAVEVLRKSGATKGESLYDLPWYMIIGPPGAGKTTALVNSGLRFPLSDRFGKTALRGVGGTRNCDWWFTDEAILLDTAGRYTTQDSQAAVDRAAWEGFLELLKKYRKRRPINGVIVAVSASDFMTMDAAQRREHASAIKDRIRELDEFFGMRFPVYVLVTKCDLINGFMDFFDDLGQEEREQVWGVTLPLDDDATDTRTGEQLDRELDALFARLDEKLLPRLHSERDLKRRGQIYSFPRQVNSLKGPLVEFLDEVFRTSRFEDSALLRGVYFSSGTQEGTPIDRVMAAISRTFGLEQQALPCFSGQGRSYFLTRLLRQVIFQEAGIAGTNQKIERRRAWLQRIAYASVFVVVALLVAGWTVSFFGNQEVIADTESAAALAETALAEIPQHRHEPEVTLVALNALRDIVADPEAERSPLFTGLFLYQGDKLAEQARAAYRRALVNQLLPRVMLRLEQQVDQTRLPLDYTYEALKTYLRLGSDKRYDAEAIGAWVTLDWQARLPREIGNENYAPLPGHLAELLEQRPAQLPLPMDEAVIRRARQKLMRIPLEERVYARLKGSNMVSGVPGFTILEQAGPESLRVFVRDSGRSLNEGIPGFFTRDGYRRVFGTDSYQLIEELSSEQWVLRDEVDLSAGQDT